MCKAHPKYTGKRPPRVACPDCRRQYVKVHWNEMPRTEIADALGISVRAVAEHARSMWLKKRVDMPANATPQDLLKARLDALLLKARKEWSLVELCNELESSPRRVNDAIEGLRADGKNVQRLNDEVIVVPKDIPVITEPVIIPVKFTKGQWFRFGAVGDNHLGSKYERVDVLNRLYDIYEREALTAVYNTGNIIDGEARFNRFDIHKHGVADQVSYFVETYPKREGITTHFVTGDDHEGWYVQREGIDIGRYMEAQAKEAGRTDLVFLGHMERDVILETPLGRTVVRVAHPGGGSAYAISYTAQKIVESYQGGEKPDILLIGHYHKAEYSYPREVHVIQTGCTQDQTPFMRKRKIQAHVGGWIVEFEQGETGAVQRFRAEFIPFFDRDYYARAWKYK